jgi:beta-xylosidase
MTAFAQARRAWLRLGPLKLSRMIAAAAAAWLMGELGAWTVPAQSTNTVLLFSFFRDNGQDGLYLARSRDGLKWTEAKPPGKSFLQPKVGGKLMRDPCLALGPDGTFHMVWTTGWNQPPVAGYARSRNLIEWSEQKTLPVMSHEPAARNVWAPELFYDEAERRWLIFWSTTIPGRFPDTDKAGDNAYNHRIYVTTTQDFETFTPTRLFYDNGFNVIDATLLKAKGKYWLILKDETRHPVKKHLRLAVSERADGPFGPAGPPFTKDWVEGPSAIQIGEEFYVYYDHYAKPQYYGAVKSRDLEQWQDVSAQVSLPGGARHGTVLRVPVSLTRALDGSTTSR